MNRLNGVLRSLLAGLIVPFAAGALQNAVWNYLFKSPFDVVTWFTVPASLGLSIVISVFVVRGKLMSFSRLLRDFARIFFPSVLALVAFIALGGFIAFDIMKPQYGVFPPLENDLFWFIAIVIASVLGIFLVHIARGGIFSEAVKQPFYRLRREPLWTVLAAATVFLLLWLVMFLLKPLGTRITNHFGFLPMYVYGSLFVVVLEYVDTRRIRRWKARFR